MRLRTVIDVRALLEEREARLPAAGISRFTASIVRALLDRNDIELSAAAIGAPLHLALWLESLAPLADIDPRLSVASRGAVSPRAWRRAVARLAIPPSPCPRWRDHLARLTRSALKRVPGHAAHLDDQQIYFSPVLPLPEASVARSAARVLFVHDLIPLKRPLFFERHDEARLRGILSSVRPDLDVVATPSMATKRDLCHHTALHPDRVFVVPLAADHRLFHHVGDPARIAAARARYGIPDGPYVLSVGTLEPRKNLAALVAAFEAMTEDARVPRMTLVLVGARGWKTDPLLRRIEHSSARERIALTGHVLDGDLAPLFSGAQIFCYPSLDEGFGLPVLEAMSCGTPVVTSNAAAILEVAGDAALLVEPEDTSALREALVRAVTDASLARELRERGLERARSFTWERSADALVAAFRFALAARTRP